MIDRRELLAILCCGGAHCNLRFHRRDALGARCGHLRRQRPASDATGSVIADAIYGGRINRRVVDDHIRHSSVIDVNVGDGHVVHSTIVVETISVPISALVADADVAVSVINSPVVADVLAPVAVVIAVPSPDKAPISGRPKKTDLRWLNPRSGNPVVALRSVTPISGCPHVAIARDRGLRVFRQFRRRLLRLHYRLAIA